MPDNIQENFEEFQNDQTGMSMQEHNFPAIKQVNGKLNDDFSYQNNVFAKHNF